MTPAEHAAEAERLLDLAADAAERAQSYAQEAVDVKTNGDPLDRADPSAEFYRLRGMARGELDAVERMTAAAQVHATLALVPDPLEATLRRITGDGGADPARHVVGSRVILLGARPGRKPERIITTDVLGTIEKFQDAADGEPLMALVSWDDGIEPTAHHVAELGVVFGA